MLLVILGLVFVILILIGVLAIGAIILKPVALPYLKSYNKPQKPLLAIFQRNGRLNLTNGNYIAEVYESNDKENPLAFFKSDTGGYRLGNTDIEIFYDGAASATSPEIVLAIEELQKRGYKNIDEVMEAVRNGQFSGDSFVTKNGVVSFDNGTISIPLIKQFDPAIVEEFSRGKPSITRAYSDTKLNIDRINRSGKFYDNPQIMSLAFLIICACIGIGILKALGVF